MTPSQAVAMTSGAAETIKIKTTAAGKWREKSLVERDSNEWEFEGRRKRDEEPVKF